MRKNRVVVEFTAAEIALMERAFIWADSYLWRYYGDLKDEGKLTPIEDKDLRRLSKDFEKLKDDINEISRPLFDKRDKLLQEREKRNTARFWKKLGL